MKGSEISCKEFRKRIAEYLGGNLDFIQARRMMHHFQICEKCRDFLRKALHKKIDEEQKFWAKCIRVKRCLSDQTIRTYVTNPASIPLNETKLIEKHLSNCELCRFHKNLIEENKV